MIRKTSFCTAGLYPILFIKKKSGTLNLINLISRPQITIFDLIGKSSNFYSIEIAAKELSLEKNEIINALIFKKLFKGYRFFLQVYN
jgi:hypothetical protein